MAGRRNLPMWKFAIRWVAIGELGGFSHGFLVRRPRADGSVIPPPVGAVGDYPHVPAGDSSEEWMRPDLRQSDHGIPVMFHLLRRFILVFVAISMPQKSKHPVFLMAQ